jgi:UDP-N-acetylmuramoyl-tripeptide--D-alanyl-D-alanine ligase
MQPGDIAAGLQTYVPPPGRGRAEACGSWTVIDDTYNANPTSMEAALRSLGDWPTAGPRIFIAGLHAQVGRAAARAKVDRLLAIGRHAGAFVQGAIAGGLPRQATAECPDLEIAYTLLDCWLEDGAVVAVKGSRATRMERVVDWLKQKAQETGGISARPRRAVA